MNKYCDQYCDVCNAEMRSLSTRYDSDCSPHYICDVYDSLTQKHVGKLLYCPNCGSVRVDLNIK